MNKNFPLPIFIKTVSFIFFNFFCFSASAEIFLKSSKADFYESNPNKNGVYPVYLSWTTENFDTESFKIFAKLSEETEYSEIATKSFSNSKDYSFIHENQSSIPGQKFDYKILSYNKNQLQIEESNICQGWGSLTPEAYFIIYNKIITKSHNKLVLMNKPKTLEKLGKERSFGQLSGTLDYKTTIKGINGLVTMIYTNYSDFPDWIFDGSMNTSANISADGTMNGTIEINGMYPGKIYYDNVIIKNGKAGGGTYDVQPNGCSIKQLDYKITFIDFDEFYKK